VNNYRAAFCEEPEIGEQLPAIDPSHLTLEIAMKRNHSLAFSTMLMIVSAVFLGGCATTGMDRSLKTSNSIQEVDNEIVNLLAQLDQTAASLDTLLRPGQPEVKKSFESYSDNVVKLENDGNRVLKRMEEMKSQSIEYFAEWEKQGGDYSNPRIRELSEERRLKLAKTYARVPAAYAGVEVAYHAYLSDLKEIQIYLSNDLTPRGIEAITPVANTTTKDLEALKSSLQPVKSALEEIKAELHGGTK
jgi:DNA repair exonuclease SbcCD ATPase subunit